MESHYPSGTAEQWTVASDDKSTFDISDDHGTVRITFSLGEGFGWIQLGKPLSPSTDSDVPVTFLVEAEATGDLEVKFLDADGTTLGVKIPLEGDFAGKTRVTAFAHDLEYWWGGDGVFSRLAEFQFAISGQGSGTVAVSDIELGQPDMKSSFVGPGEKRSEAGLFTMLRPGPHLDPDRNAPGIGFRQRRAAAMTPEDPGVLEWLKTMQDESSPARQVLPTTEDNECHTFNNSLVAMAFLVKGETGRAERILDFFANATDRDNMDPSLQNFFYNGEARGFFQYVALNESTNGIAPYHNPGKADRWMGDMAWLLMAYKYYEQKNGPERYREITGLLKDLLISWFKKAEEVPGGGYVQHGWRKGDAYLHENHGHAEGNIDCYAVFKLYGEEEQAEKVRVWIEAVTRGESQPLDIYTWQVLAYDGDKGELLDIPDHDLRYRKELAVNGRQVIGPYHSAAPGITNIWLDGLGHIACAYFATGNKERGFFYANQFDAFLMDSSLGGRKTRTLPYTANRQGGFDFDQSKGVLSAAAWYIFAKNQFNPMRLTQK
ncbi:MAG: hypothetical protein KJ626_15290 [Verrucomicrobia bacterium]|nr:hypothetical protein [Verrucomicrobiota bacterium]